MKKSIQGAAAVLILLLLLSHPVLAYEGAKSGLLLWSQTVLPTLLPFMICSNVIVALDAIHFLTWPFQPLLRHVLMLSPAGSYILISGLLCGYPMGAKTCSEFLDDGRISSQEACYLLSICNHPSPMFLLGYVAGCMASNIPMTYILAALYLPILPLSVLSRKFYGIHGISEGITKKDENTLSFDKTMMRSVEVMVKIGGYIMLFSILACFLQQFLQNYGSSQAILLGVVEITTGIQALSFHMTGSLQALAIVGVTAFGGMSGIFQTNSVISEQSKKSSACGTPAPERDRFSGPVSSARSAPPPEGFRATGSFSCDTKNAGLSIRHYVLWKLLHSVLSVSILILLLQAFPLSR